MCDAHLSRGALGDLVVGFLVAFDLPSDDWVEHELITVTFVAFDQYRDVPPRKRRDHSPGLARGHRLTSLSRTLDAERGQRLIPEYGLLTSIRFEFGDDPLVELAAAR